MPESERTRYLRQLHTVQEAEYARLSEIERLRAKTNEKLTDQDGGSYAFKTRRLALTKERGDCKHELSERPLEKAKTEFEKAAKLVGASTAATLQEGQAVEPYVLQQMIAAFVQHVSSVAKRNRERMAAKRTAPFHLASALFFSVFAIGLAFDKEVITKLAGLGGQFALFTFLISLTSLREKKLIAFGVAFAAGFVLQPVLPVVLQLMVFMQWVIAIGAFCGLKAERYNHPLLEPFPLVGFPRQG